MLQFIRFSIFLSITHLFIFSVFSTANAQTPQRDARPRTASVSGRVTISGKAAANAKIVITEIKDKTGAEGRLFSIEELESNAGDDYVALTDAEGRYRATDLPEGKYKARALLGGCVREKSSPATTSDSLVESFSLDEGESRGNVDFALARGGVITGRVTDADGRPLIARSVGLKVVDEEKGLRSDIRAIPGFQNLMATFEMFQTDDRGVYRIYGLPAGRYLVSAGGGSDIELIASARGKYPRVWYPDAADENQAKVIDVAAGAEQRKKLMKRRDASSMTRRGSRSRASRCPVSRPETPAPA